MNWMQVENYLRTDDRVVLPIGATEQHAYLSLATDSILAERVRSRRRSLWRARADDAVRDRAGFRGVP
jgi:creatinine amidohydrolase/Fe(II)-dependent formamide hydrolase-like protein